MVKIWWFEIFLVPLHRKINHGALTKRLCGGLQNHIEQFDSATHLTTESESFTVKLSDFLFSVVAHFCYVACDVSAAVCLNSCSLATISSVSSVSVSSRL